MRGDQVGVRGSLRGARSGTSFFGHEDKDLVVAAELGRAVLMPAVPALKEAGVVERDS